MGGAGFALGRGEWLEWAKIKSGEMSREPSH